MCGVLLFGSFYFMMKGIYVWASGEGSLQISTWKTAKTSENTRIQGARVMGLVGVVAISLFVLGVSVIYYNYGKVEYIEAGQAASFLCILGAVAVLSCGFIWTSRRSFEAKWKHRTSTDPSKTAVCAVVAVSALVLVPVCFSFSGMDEDITATLGDDGISVTGPWFDYTFKYSDIETIYLDRDFDRGEFVVGHDTSTSQSGICDNSQFGEYRLATYTKVGPCIVITVDGKYYVFNQSSADATTELYERLSQRISA